MASSANIQSRRRRTSSGRAVGRRSRSFGGCVTCRSRRTKCDEGRPECSMCSFAGFVCGGYGKSIFFDFEDAAEGGEARFRRPLLTMEERERMSDQLVADVPPVLAMWHISQVDDECDRASSASGEIQISRGPFGVFRVAESCPTSDSSMDTPLAEPEDATEPSPAQELAQPETDYEGDMLLRQEDMFLFSQESSMRFSILKQTGPSPPTPMTEWMNMAGWVPTADDMDTNVRLELPIWCDIETPLPTERIQEVYEDIPLPNTQQLPNIASGTSALPHPAIPSPNSIAPSIDCAIPHDAVFLLKHYAATVLRGLTPYRHSKTPWHVLFIPHVKNCLAALTLDEDVDHANKCTFFGTLAISAFSLGGICHSPEWLQQGRLYQQQTQAHYQLMLETAYSIPKTAKYKSILMALLTMMQISLLFGDRDQTECYVLEVEKFIRLRGLGRRKSRKVRLLHHCYAYERMIYESTVPASKVNSIHRDSVRKAIESSDAAAYSHDSLSFQLGPWNNLDQEMMKVKGQQAGENDLHLQLPGIWSETLYPEIFGMPEMHIFLLSLVIRLWREKDGTHQGALHGSIGLKEFFTRAKAVESIINKLNQLRKSIFIAKAPPDPDHHQSLLLLDSLSDTMQQALAIYFYRSVYDIDRTAIQQNVIGVRDSLLRFDAVDSGKGYYSLRLVWPAAIAACEADDPAVRASFTQWFESSGKKSGLRIFSDKQAEVRRAWEDRDRSEGRFEAWMTVSC